MLRSSGISLRLGRIFDPASHNTVVVALDHGLFMGPLPGLRRPADVAAQLFEAGVDAIQSPPGQAVDVANCAASRSRASILFRLESTNACRTGSFSPSPGFWAP